MRSAAPKTYISRRMLDSYSEQRQTLSESGENTTTKEQAPIVPSKTFAEDQTFKSNAATKGSTVLTSIEEE